MAKEMQQMPLDWSNDSQNAAQVPLRKLEDQQNRGENASHPYLFGHKQ